MELEHFPAQFSEEDPKVGDLVAIVSTVDSSEVTTPYDLSEPIETHIGILERYDAEENLGQKYKNPMPIITKAIRLNYNREKDVYEVNIVHYDVRGKCAHRLFDKGIISILSLGEEVYKHLNITIDSDGKINFPGNYLEIKQD